MSDPGPDGPAADPDLDADLDLGDGDRSALDAVLEQMESAETAESVEPLSTGGPRRRLVGVLSLALGIVGMALAILFGLASVRLGFEAGGTVDRTVETLDAAVSRLETRIDQADDLIADPDRNAELHARVDGLVDVAVGARQSFDAVGDHPLYGRLPIDTSALGDALADFEAASLRIDADLGDPDRAMTPAVREAVSAELNALQAETSTLRERIDETGQSLRRWLRLAGLGGFFLAPWALWGQLLLARRGWRGMVGRAL